MNKKIVLASVSALALAGTFAAGVFAASDIKLLINGKAVSADVQIVDGSSYVPLRVVSESIGANIKWDGDSRTITIIGKVPELPIDGLYTAGDLNFYDLKMENSSSWWKLSSEVKNSGSRPIKGASFTAVFYGDDGKRLGTASGNTNNLGVSDIKTEHLISTDDLTGYKTIKFQIDASY